MGLVALSGAFGACGGRTLDDESGGIGGRAVGGRGGADDAEDGGSTSSGGLEGIGGSMVISGGTSSGGAEPASGGSGATSAGGTGGACVPHFQYDCDTLDSYIGFEPSSGQCVAMSGRALCEPYSQAGTLFTSLADCLASCPGSVPQETACDVDSDCRLDSAGCCGACSPVSAEDFRAYNGEATVPSCPPIACGPCLDPPELERNSAYFRATCEDRVCTVTDMTQSAFAACDNSDQCFLRDGTGCCEDCDDRAYVPLSSLGFLGGECSLVDCASCEPLPPELGLVAVCDSQTNHCVKAELLP